MAKKKQKNKKTKNMVLQDVRVVIDSGALHLRILARDPSTTKSEGFSLLCYPAWGGPPFLSDLGAYPFGHAPMSTPGLEWTHHRHPGNSDIAQHTTTLSIPLPSQKHAVTS